MNPDGSIDTSSVTFAGNELGEIQMKVGDEPPILLFTADVPGIREYRLTRIVAKAGSKEGLKISGVTRFRLVVEEIDARLAEEDGADFNRRCDQVELVVGTLYAAKRYCGTIKGESKRIAIKVGKQIGHGKETDWDYGNFSDQGNKKTIECSLEAKTNDGSAVCVRVITASKPTLIGPSFKVDTKLSGGWFYPVFNFIKDLFRTFGKNI